MQRLFKYIINKRFIKRVYICILSFIIFKSLSFYEELKEEIIPLHQLKSNIVVLYAYPAFHEEVVSSMACLLYDSGYYVIVYIGSGLHIGDMIVPFSGTRKITSQKAYGNCVSQWITINPNANENNVKYIKNPELMIFITYPMITQKFVPDYYAVNLIKRLNIDQATTSIIFVAHRSNELLCYLMQTIRNFIPITNVYYLFLSEHTKIRAVDYLINSNKNKDKSCLNIFSKNNNNNRIKNNLFELNSKSSYEDIITYKFQINGKLVENYNSTVSFVRNINGQIDYYIENELVFSFVSIYPVRPPKYMLLQASHSLRHSNRDISKQHISETIFVMQGNFGGKKHLHKKDPEGVVACLQSIENEKDFNSYVSIDFVGKLRSKFSMGDLKTGKIRFLSDLDSIEYYNSISKAKFMLAGTKDNDYYYSRATSSIPAALMTSIPLVLNTKFLDLYPCLRDAKIHKLVSKSTECLSIKASLLLNDDQYSEMKEELRNCSNIFWNQGKELLNNIAKKKKK